MYVRNYKDATSYNNCVSLEGRKTLRLLNLDGRGTRRTQLRRLLSSIAVVGFLILLAGNFFIGIAQTGLQSSNRNVAVINSQAIAMFGRYPFLDERLQLKEFIIVPDMRKCSNATFVVVVHVRADDGMLRNTWRATYGNQQVTAKFMYSLIFSVGKDSTVGVQKKLLQEGRLHGDILQANYIDSYRNLTLKHLSELRYVASACQSLKAVVKLDDDVAWNIEETLNFVENNLTENELYCARRINSSPILSRGYKWTVSREEWNRTDYPTYCHGMTYIASLSAIKRMLNVVHMQSFFWVDDVFITGVLTEASKVAVKTLTGVSKHVKIPKKLVKETYFLVEKKDIQFWFSATNPDVSTFIKTL